MEREDGMEDGYGGRRTLARTDDAEGGSLMSRRVPRTLRTLKLDYREIAALLLASLTHSLSLCFFLCLSVHPSLARFLALTQRGRGCSPSSSSASSTTSAPPPPAVFSFGLLRPPRAIHLRYVVLIVLPLVRVACIRR